MQSSGVAKWVNSKLHGVWRGHLAGVVRPLLEAMAIKRAREFVTLCSRLPSVAARMAVFQEIGSRPELEDALLWGLRDPHPWVRRSAISRLVRISVESEEAPPTDDVVKVIERGPDPAYPGHFDEVVTAAVALQYWSAPTEAVRGAFQARWAGRAPSEVKAVAWALKNELVGDTWWGTAG